MSGQTQQKEIVKDYDFNQGTAGWAAEFTDYPEGREDFYKLSAKHAPLPEPLDTNRGGFSISGSNRSDDLFMFIKTKISGLMKGQQYEAQIEVELASDAQSKGIGIGGAPGESVFLKSGLTQVEPVKVLQEGFYRLNVDKDNQGNSGKDLKLMGHVANGKGKSEYTLLQRSLKEKISVSANDNGELWAIIGTDSGFEGVTTLYYTKVSIHLTPSF